MDGRSTLDDVQEWLVPILGLFLADTTSTASELAGLWELGFADVAAGEYGEPELHDLLGDFLRDHEAIQVNIGHSITSAATNSIGMVGPVQIGESAPSWSLPSPVGR